MTSKILNPDYPIIIGLSGPAGSGKTSVASSFVPAGVINVVEIDHTPKYIIDHYWFAMPLYEMATIRQQIEGEKVKDRTYYAIHEVLVDLYSRSPLYGAPPYDELNALVHAIADLPCPKDEKPRTFLQTVGDMCRFYDKDCFVKWAVRRIQVEANRQMVATEDYDEPLYIAFISDLRFDNEAAAIANSPNGFVVQFTAEQEVLDERLEKRDGYIMSQEQKNHISEQQLIKPEHIHEILDTSNMTLEQQVMTTKKLIIDRFNLKAF